MRILCDIRINSIGYIRFGGNFRGMKKLEAGDSFILYNIDNKYTFIASDRSILRLAVIYAPSKIFINNKQRYIKPVARFTVRRLHNNDPITII